MIRESAVPCLLGTHPKARFPHICAPEHSYGIEPFALAALCAILWLLIHDNNSDPSLALPTADYT